MSATSEIKVEIQYGYYSEKQKNLRFKNTGSQRGRYPMSNIYLDQQGNEIEITEVSKKSPEEFDKRLPFTKRMDFFFPQLVKFYESHGHFRVRRVDDEKLYDFNRKLMVKYTRWKYLAVPC